MEKVTWIFNPDYARNVVIFGIDNSLSSHIDNLKNNFLVLSEGLTEGINGSVGATGKKIASKENTKFCLSWNYNRNESYFYVNKTDIYKFIRKTNISWCNICFGNVSKDFAKDEQSKLI